MANLNRRPLPGQPQTLSAEQVVDGQDALLAGEHTFPPTSREGATLAAACPGW